MRAYHARTCLLQLALRWSAAQHAFIAETDPQRELDLKEKRNDLEKQLLDAAVEYAKTLVYRKKGA